MCEFFPGIAHSVNDLQTILHNIEWFNSNFFESVEFVSLFFISLGI